jgi:DNA-binding GntR family transcriptional regulator
MQIAKEMSVSNGSSRQLGRPNRITLSRAEQAYRRLREAIHSGDLKPGDRLLEETLARSLGFSRTPVHDALARLESEGLAAKDPSQGMIVAKFDANFIAELYAVREALEGTAAALAARHASEDEVLTLQQITGHARAFAQDHKRLAKNNRLFHEALYRSAHNKYLLKTLNALYESISLERISLSYSYYNEERVRLTIEQHQGIVAAIERQDSKGAEELARFHIRIACKARIALMLEISEEI